MCWLNLADISAFADTDKQKNIPSLFISCRDVQKSACFPAIIMSLRTLESANDQKYCRHCRLSAEMGLSSRSLCFCGMGQTFAFVAWVRTKDCKSTRNLKIDTVLFHTGGSKLEPGLSEGVLAAERTCMTVLSKANCQSS